MITTVPPCISHVFKAKVQLAALLTNLVVLFRETLIWNLLSRERTGLVKIIYFIESGAKSCWFHCTGSSCRFGTLNVSTYYYEFADVHHVSFYLVILIAYQITMQHRNILTVDWYGDNLTFSKYHFSSTGSADRPKNPIRCETYRAIQSMCSFHNNCSSSTNPRYFDILILIMWWL